MKNLLVICGGKSAEHEVSIRSARNIISALDQQAYKPILVTVSRSGSWYLSDSAELPESITECDDAAFPGELATLLRQPDSTLLITTTGKTHRVDIAFPLIHGPMGEDGTLQGLLEMMEVPYVGSGVLASAIGMDKDVLKRILANANIPIVPFIAPSSFQQAPSFAQACEHLNSSILFVKPSIMGSSVGIYKVKTAAEYDLAVSQAFKFCHKILIEKYIPGREVECSVLGNLNPQASCVGEIRPNHEFYSYEAKYIDPNGADLIIPADFNTMMTNKIRDLAIQTFQAIECKGFARVDFFVTEDTVYVNELNSIPGFTSISMYPKMWEASGLSYSALISQLLVLAMEEFALKQQLHFRPETLTVAHPAKIAIA